MHAVALHISPEHPAFAGHFPGQPLLPGVSLLAEVIEAILADAELAACIGTAPIISSAKFLAPVRPGAELVVQLLRSERALKFEVREGARMAASGQFDVKTGATS